MPVALAAVVAVAMVATAPHARAGAGFLAPIVVGQKAFEPGMHVAPDGTLYIEGPTGLLSGGISSPSSLFRSRDDGATWVATAPGLRGVLPGGGDATLAVAPNGDLAFADLWAGSSTVARSSDQGDSWLALPAAGLPIQDRPWLANSGTAVYLAYHQLPSGIGVSRSFGDGLFYPLTTVAATILDQEGCLTCAAGTIIAAPGGTAFTDRVGVVFSAQNGGVKFSRSLDDGLTWSVRTLEPSGTANTTLVFPTVADAGGGNLVATWLDVTDTRSIVRLATSTDWGDTWSAPRTLTTAGTSVYPWVAAKGSKIAISLYWNASESTADTTPADTPWYESYSESTDFGASFTPLTAADPTPVKFGPICTGGSTCGANRELGDFQSVAIDNQGRSDLAYNRSIADGTSVEVRFTRQC
ncbi:sialidase family protein [Nocardia sp. CDC160]|uniref:sialidase family protein n=1 Tax=Nocardia sp. CDC160 TaxID=3112166 RepID=UPI002DBFFF94|nr:sialidase family protein [Nocardia sp. CDC160]MEC3918824.1 sialidase family protein [Nocardia sp. CDC160]